LLFKAYSMDVVSMKASHKISPMDRELFPIAQGSVPKRIFKGALRECRMRRMHP
jgi:two-component system, NarL family, sensor histidine kinase UhpB